jgi:hypothetical protein
VRSRAASAGLVRRPLGNFRSIEVERIIAMKVGEAARRLGVSPATIDSLVASGKLRCYTVADPELPSARYDG